MTTSISRRMLLSSAIAVLATAAASAKPSRAGPRVLLVCQSGSVKSAIARELLKKRAAERGFALDVASRGITPEQHLPRELDERLRAEGIAADAQPLRKLHRHDVSRADIVVVFDRLPANMTPKRLIDWTSLPSMLNSYPEARADLEKRIDWLLDNLGGPARR